MNEKISVPQCVFIAAEHSSPFALEFHKRDGRIHGFPYGHLLNYLFEANPNADAQPHAPPDRFSLWFSTHDVVLFGWQLRKFSPFLQQARVVSVRAQDVRYYSLSDQEVFVSEIVVQCAQKG